MDEELKPWEQPGTPRGNEIVQRDAQQSFTENAEDSFKANTAAGPAIRVVQDEALPLAEQMFPQEDPAIEEALDTGAMVGGELRHDVRKYMAGIAALVGFRAGEPDYDRTEKYDELTEGIPFQFHDEIVGHDNLGAATRARARIQEQLERGQRMGLQRGTSSTLAIMAGSMVDIDLPLMAVTGGGFQAARIARASVRLGAATGIKTGIATRIGSTAVGASAGLQAGLASGLGQKVWNETADWTTVAEAAMAGALMGGTLNGVLKGDLGLQIRAAQEDLYERMARDAPDLTRTANVDELTPQTLNFPEPTSEGADVVVTPKGEFDQNINAARTPGVLSSEVRTKLETEIGASPRELEVTSMTEEWTIAYGWRNRKKDAEKEWLYKYVVGSNDTVDALGNGIARRAADDYNSILSSESPTAGFLAGAVFESPHGFGRGRVTAAVLQEQYNKQIMEPMVRANEAMMRWAQLADETFIPSVKVGPVSTKGAGVSQRGQAMFGKEVQIEINRRRLGRSQAPTTDAEKAVHEAADLLGGEGAKRALNIGKGRNGEKSIDGFDALEEGHYFPFTWQGRVMRDWIKSGKVRKSDLIDDLASGYKSAGYVPAGGKDVDKVAKAIARALVTRMEASSEGISMSLRDLLHADGRAFLEKMLSDAGVTRAEIGSIIDRISGVKEEAGKLSNVKRRNDIDLEMKIRTTDGSDLKVVDLMDPDINGTWNRYARSVAGSAALARVGITNRAQRETMITAMTKEQAALGEKGVDPAKIRAMFTHFDGGPVHGVLAGRTNEGMGPLTSLAKRLTSVSLLQGLGFAQIAETGAVATATGLANFANRGIFERLSKMGREQQKATLRDAEFLTGRIGEDHKFLAPHLELDAVGRGDMSEAMAGVQQMLGKAQYLNGYTSLFNQVRSWQQTTVALGLMDKIIQQGLREVDGKRVGWTDAQLFRLDQDFGIDASMAKKLTAMVDDGTITIRDNLFGGKAVDRLNFDQWKDMDFADEFAAGVTRSVNQQVQKSMAGEQDVWMNNEVMSLFMQFKAFPLQSITKQAARHLRFMDKETMGAVLMGLATAYGSLYLRDLAYGRERSVADRAKASLTYSNMTGFLPMAWDPAMSMVGLEDYRFSQFGRYHENSVPVVDVTNRLFRTPAAAIDGLDNDLSKSSQSALKALPFMNMPFFAAIAWD